MNHTQKNMLASIHFTLNLDRLLFHYIETTNFNVYKYLTLFKY